MQLDVLHAHFIHLDVAKKDASVCLISSEGECYMYRIVHLRVYALTLFKHHLIFVSETQDTSQILTKRQTQEQYNRLSTYTALRTSHIHIVVIVANMLKAGFFICRWQFSVSYHKRHADTWLGDLGTFSP